MLKGTLDRIKEIHVGRVPIGGIFLLIVIGGLALVVAFVLWNLMDGIPYWAYKIGLVFAALYVFGSVLKKDEFGWLKQREYMSFRVELLCSDLDLIRASSVNFGIIGKIGEANTYYAELSTGKLETARDWREKLDEAKRPYKYVTSIGTLRVNDPKW